jgi:surfactin synthase thioesterase subunit
VRNAVSRVPATTTKWLARPPSATAAGRVFCIPHAGCGVSIFRNFPERAGAVEFLPVDLPGRLTRFGEPMPETFQDLAAAIVEGLERYLDVPFALFGHCWSALAAYEVAIQLSLAGLPAPARLFVSSQFAPEDDLIAGMMVMDESELAAELEKVVRDMGQRPHPELVAIYVNVLRTDLDMIRRYRASDPAALPCPVTAIGWSEDTDITPEQMRGWSAYSDTSFVVFPGQHHRFIDAPPEFIGVLAGLGRTDADR